MGQDRYLIKKDEIAAMEGVEKTHFLNENARRVNKSLGDAAGLTGLGFHLIEVAPGAETTEFHTHYYEDECVYILSGAATAVIGDEEFAVSEGDFIGYRKGGLAHSIRNTGEEPLRCLVAGQRLDHDVADYPHKRKRIFRNKDMAWNLADQDQIEELGGTVGKK